MTDQIKIRVLASGSSGNSTFVRVGNTRLLIDAGISCRRIESGLADIGEAAGALDGILVTHEHSDHISGMKVFGSNYPDIPVFATAGTMDGCKTHFEQPCRWRSIQAGRLFRIGQLTAEPFELHHDANDPTGFRLDGPGFSLGVATDLGIWDDNIAKCLVGCRVLIIEANHDSQMLQSGPYPGFLKRRIASNVGHLSNDQARALVSRIGRSNLEWLVLAHLSETNNDADVAADAVHCPAIQNTAARVIAADSSPGELIELTPTDDHSARPPRQGVLF